MPLVTPLDAVLSIPALAVVVLAFVGNYRLGAALNVLASGLTFAAGVSLLFVERVRTDILIIDDFNIYLVTLTTFVGFTTSIFSASYIGHELETGHLTPVSLRFYHALYQAMMGAMTVALVANNIGLLWVGVEVVTLSTVMMVGIYGTPEAIAARLNEHLEAGADHVAIQVLGGWPEDKLLAALGELAGPLGLAPTS